MKALKHLNKYFIKYKYRLFLGVFACVVSRYLAVKVPEFVRTSIDVAALYKAGKISVEGLESTLIENIGLILGFVLLSGFFTFLMRQTIIVTSRFIEFDLKNEIFQKYQRFSIGFYKKNRTGDFMNRISDDVSKVRMYIGPAVMYSINMLIFMGVAIFKMLQTDTMLTFYTLIPFPFLSAFVFTVNSIVHQRSTERQEQLSAITTYCQEVFSGIGVIKSFSILGSVKQRFEKLAVDSRIKNIRLYAVKAFFFPGMILLIGISNLIVIYIGGKHYSEGTISMGTIAEFVLYVNMLTWPVAIIGWVSATIKEAEVSQKRINDFLMADEEISCGRKAFPKDFKKIEFKNVSLTYEDTGITALKNINLTIKKGERIGIWGKTGSGKSSLISLLIRFYEPTSGEITVDGTPIGDFDLSGLRKNFSLLPQEPFLFSDTIANNIRFSNENYSEQKIVAAAKLAAVHQNIIGFSKGYDTILGERGVTLSGGQKQRVSIARAFIKKDFEMLLLDDMLSAVDTETATAIINHIYADTVGKTMLMISHQKSSLKGVDKILIFEEGAFVKTTTPSEFL